MSDWADEKAKEILPLTLYHVAQALRDARQKAILDSEQAATMSIPGHYATAIAADSVHQLAVKK